MPLTFNDADDFHWIVRKIAVVGPGIVGMPMAALLAAARIREGTDEPARVVVVQRASPTSGWKVAAINAGPRKLGPGPIFSGTVKPSDSPIDWPIQPTANKRIALAMATKMSLNPVIRRKCSSSTPGSELRLRIAATMQGQGVRLATDPDLQERIDESIQRGVYYVVDNYRSEVSGLIESTIAKWDGPSTARLMELQVGRDLQFIRINGTIVGGLVGVLIHAVSLAVQ